MPLCVNGGRIPDQMHEDGLVFFKKPLAEWLEHLIPCNKCYERFQGVEVYQAPREDLRGGLGEGVVDGGDVAQICQ